jgi:hypothetical protein
VTFATDFRRRYGKEGAAPRTTGGAGGEGGMGEVWRRRCRLALALLGWAVAAATGVTAAAAPRGAWAAERVALVIGNGAYRHAPPLPNPPNDARAVASALKGIGFQVVEGTDLDMEGMRAAIGAFEKALGRDARVGLVFYAGHGMQVDGENYLIPVDAELETSSDLKFKTVAATWLLDGVLGDGPGGEGRVSIVMLDACRDNPLTRSFARRTRSATGSGLADITAADGAYIVFATAPGNVAEDGRGANSPFTTAVLRNIARPGVEINSMMNAVRGEVYAETGKRQRPYATSALLGDFYFVPPSTVTAALPPAASPSPPAVAPPAAATRAEPAAPTPPAAASPQPSPEEQRLAALLRVENALLPTGAAHREVQAALKALGHDSGRGRPDGRFGPGTRDAVRDFQAVAKLEITGYVDRPTLDALRRQSARLQAAPETGQRQPAPARPTPPEPAVATLPPPAPPPVAEPAAAPVVVVEPPRPPAPTPPPQLARSFPAATMGMCRMQGGGFDERQLMYAQCRKLGGAFTPFDD